MKAVSHLLLVCSMAASAAAYAAGAADGVQVVDPYVRAIPPGARATAAFMVLKNNGADTQLVKAESGAAKSVELHSHIDKNGVMEMRQVPAIELKAKAETALKPGGFHIMMVDPTASLKPGDKIAMTLRFADGSSKQIEMPVKMPAAMPMPMADHAHMH
jgi:copper(I)-binding protein